MMAGRVGGGTHRLSARYTLLTAATDWSRLSSFQCTRPRPYKQAFAGALKKGARVTYKRTHLQTPSASTPPCIGTTQRAHCTHAPESVHERLRGVLERRLHAGERELYEQSARVESWELGAEHEGTTAATGRTETARG
eukprot:CAMPEP_0183357674 /NCGR_PEP_ID=MMETSP0164_2-20130417/46984_1 /TAXON_ID=221442 /ORGANISM="Coccolithus pelagicus ssp braarudi, Strain PLY182g" /LENGTH=137 /DNA_ID=CAMNT_0025531353 /DNA_START=134 /DNA_END=547 /DNA_ORIENTATION=-